MEYGDYTRKASKQEDGEIDWKKYRIVQRRASYSPAVLVILQRRIFRFFWTNQYIKRVNAYELSRESINRARHDVINKESERLRVQRAINEFTT